MKMETREGLSLTLNKRLIDIDIKLELQDNQNNENHDLFASIFEKLNILHNKVESLDKKIDEMNRRVDQETSCPIDKKLKGKHIKRLQSHHNPIFKRESKDEVDLKVLESNANSSCK